MRTEIVQYIREILSFTRVSHESNLPKGFSFLYTLGRSYGAQRQSWLTAAAVTASVTLSGPAGAQEVGRYELFRGPVTVENGAPEATFMLDTRTGQVWMLTQVAGEAIQWRPLGYQAVGGLSNLPPDFSVLPK